MRIAPLPLKFIVMPAASAMLLAVTVLLPVPVLSDNSGSNGKQALEAEAASQEADAYYTELARMLGRLQVGYELYRNGDRADGGRHFAALAEQHLPVVRDALASRDLDLLIRRIEQLAKEAERSNSWLDVQDLHEASRMSLQHALNRVDPDTREDPAFKVDIVVALARVAVDHYEQSLEDGEFVRPEAYQAGHGYIGYGRSLLQRNAGLLEQGGNGQHDALVERYESVMEGWPSLRLPAEPAVSVDELRNRLAKLESAAQGF